MLSSSSIDVFPGMACPLSAVLRCCRPPHPCCAVQRLPPRTDSPSTDSVISIRTGSIFLRLLRTLLYIPIHTHAGAMPKLPRLRDHRYEQILPCISRVTPRVARPLVRSSAVFGGCRMSGWVCSCWRWGRRRDGAGGVDYSSGGRGCADLCTCA